MTREMGHAMTRETLRKLAGECLTTALLLATVVGSGIMAAKLSGGNVALALLGNTLATGAVLVVLITIFGPVSGAHMNPAVSLVMAINGDLPWRLLAPYIAAQVLGGILGVFAAHLMFDLPVLQFSTTLRTGPAQWFAEGVATFGLVLTIFGGLRYRADAIPMLVGFYISAAYWFTASTSFANPAVTIARALSDTFAGIAPAHAPAFIAAQFIGALIAYGANRFFWTGFSAAADRPIAD